MIYNISHLDLYVKSAYSNYISLIFIYNLYQIVGVVHIDLNPLCKLYVYQTGGVIHIGFK
jgi:hypothetical protein